MITRIFKKKFDDRTETKELIEHLFLSLGKTIPLLSIPIEEYRAEQTRRQTRYILGTMREIYERVLFLEKNEKLNYEYCKSDDFHRIAGKVFLIVERENREEKRKLLADFFANSFSKDLSDSDFKDMVLDTIDKLNSQALLDHEKD